MRIGLSFDLKEAIHVEGGNFPEDAFEEYDSPATIEYLESALKTNANSIVRLGGGREFLQKVLSEHLDIVFNISEGRGTFRSREAQVPAVLEMLNIPYTGSDPLCLAVSLDKPLTKRILSAYGITTPPWYVINDSSELAVFAWSDINYPAIIKPAFEGSSKGVRLNSIVKDAGQATEVAKNTIELYRQPVMVEGFISGDEVTVGIVGNSSPRIIGIMRILPRIKNDYFVYSLEVKRDWKALVDYECPARLNPETLDAIKDSSLKIFQILGCRDFSRIDYRIDADGKPYFIEINPLPGLGDYSDLVIMALQMGWTHDKLINAVLDAALERYNLCR